MVVTDCPVEADSLDDAVLTCAGRPAGEAVKGPSGLLAGPLLDIFSRAEGAEVCAIAPLLIGDKATNASEAHKRK